MRVAIAGSNCLAYWLGSMLKNHPLHHFIILSRSPKPAFSSNGWPVHVVNFNNENDLIHNLGGVDIVISMVTGDTQLLLIDAALKAHVTRFVPSEFAGQHNKRPATLNRGHVFAINRLKQHIEEGMYFTVFACGIFYDTFVPGGLRSSNMGHVSTNGNNGEGSFLMDLRSKRAQIPLDASGRPAKICMTLIFDVARFIVAAMDIPLHKWCDPKRQLNDRPSPLTHRRPREFRMRGERLDVSSIVRLAENLRGKS